MWYEIKQMMGFEEIAYVKEFSTKTFLVLKNTNILINIRSNEFKCLLLDGFIRRK